MVSCPFCRRVYKMMLDRTLAKERGTRASCGRCGNSFELAARIVVTMNSNLGTGLPGGRFTPQPASTLNPAAVPPPPPPQPKRAQAAAQPVAVADVESDESLTDMANDIARAADELLSANQPTLADAATRADIPVAAAPSEAVPVPAEPFVPSACEVEVPATIAPSDESSTQLVAASAPRDWLERADPGLSRLTRAEPDAVRALRELLP